MAQAARFGPPVREFATGGAHVAVHLVPVFEGSLVAFDIAAKEARGRWLPWDLLPYAGNPYETAAELGDQWCDGAVNDLTLVDTLSLPAQGESWELALVFRAELFAPPAGDNARIPALLGEDDLGTVTRFDAVDLARWIHRAGDSEPPLPAERRGGNLLF